MWVLGENATESNRCKVNLEVSAAESKIMAKKTKQNKLKNHGTKKSNFMPEEKRQKHKTQQFPVGEERIRALKAGGGSGGASSGVSY